MKTILTTMIVCLILASMPALALGQGAPAQIDAALLDLSARLGTSVGIGNLSNWRWEQTSFPNDALGCPTVASAGEAAILGYKFQLTRDAITYDYRVSSDSALVVYCGQIDPAVAAAASAPAAQRSNRLCDEAAADGPYLPSRVNIGMDVEAAGSYVNMRGQPSADAQVLLQIPAGWPLGLTGGPECVDGYVWWLALVNGQTGYIAESGAGSYLVAPIAPPELPSREVLNASLLPFLLEFGRVSGNFQPAQAWSSDGAYLAMPGARGSEGLWVYDLRQPILEPQILALDEGVSALAFRPRRQQFIVGSESGALQLWQIHDSAPLTFSERLRLNAHAGPVSALAFSPDGERLVSAGAEAYTHVDANRNWAAIVWDLPTVAQQAILSGHQDLIRAIAYQSSEPIIVTGGDDTAQRLWSAESGANISSLDYGAPAADLAFSPDGSLMAIALRRAADNLLIFEGAQGSPVASYPAPTGNLTSLDFSPGGAMLAVGSADGVFSVWNTKTHQLIATRETDGAIHDISFSPDGTLIAISSDRHSLTLYGVPLGSG